MKKINQLPYIIIVAITAFVVNYFISNDSNSINNNSSESSVNNKSEEQYKVVGISDGDTFTLLKDSTQIKIRLNHIDCPEKKQAFGTKAKQFASDLCFGKFVTIDSDLKKDRYGRLIGEVYVGNICVNKELVKAGLAWHYKQYSSDTEYENLENVARLNKVGLWGDKNPIEPWNWRKNKKIRNQ